MLKLMTAVPAYTMLVDAEQINMWLSLGVAVGQSNTVKLIHNYVVSANPVGHARNLILQEAIKVGADYIFSIDSDTMLQDGKDIVRMVESAHAMNIQMLGAAVPWRVPVDTKSALMVWGRDRQFIDPRLFKNKIHECYHMATAAYVADVNWVKENLTYPWYTTVIDKDLFVAEDIYFCTRVAENGGKIAVDGRVATSHVCKRSVLEFNP
jgi:hypothetical protein